MFPHTCYRSPAPSCPKIITQKVPTLTDIRSQYSSSQHFVLKRMLSNFCNIPIRNQKFDKNHFMKLYTELVSLFQAIGNIPSLICYELLFNSFEGVWSWLLTQSSIPSSNLLTSHKDRLPLVFIARSLSLNNAPMLTEKLGWSRSSKRVSPHCSTHWFRGSCFDPRG